MTEKRTLVLEEYEIQERKWNYTGPYRRGSEDSYLQKTIYYRIEASDYRSEHLEVVKEGIVGEDKADRLFKYLETDEGEEFLCRIFDAKYALQENKKLGIQLENERHDLFGRLYEFGEFMELVELGKI